MCRYITRPAIANEWLKSPCRDATTRIVISPLQLLLRLAALVPRPQLHLIRFYGVLAPLAKLRVQIVPSASVTVAEICNYHAQSAIWHGCIGGTPIAAPNSSTRI